MMKLEDLTLAAIKKLVVKINKQVKVGGGYSKMKKPELVKLLRSHPGINVVESEKGVKLESKEAMSSTRIFAFKKKAAPPAPAKKKVLKVKKKVKK